MKELPYFRFTIQEWQNGGISTLNDSLKGVFIDICAFYWAQNCQVTIETLSNKFKTRSKSIQKLIETQTIHDQNGIVSISFLDQQLTELKQNKTFFSEMGKLGQKAKKIKAPLKTDLSYKIRSNKDKDNDNIIDRGKKFNPPTFDQIKNLVDLNNYKVNPETFFNHYEGNGWRIGKNKMKSWEATIRGWNSRDKQATSRKSFAERDDENLGNFLKEQNEKWRALNE